VPRALDLFLDTDQPLDRLADELSDLTGRPLVAAPDRNRYVMHDDEVVAHLSGHDFLDDDGLPLSEFRYVLSCSVPYGTEVETSAEMATLRHVSALLRDKGALPCLLVIDLERPDVPGGTAEPAQPGGGAE